MLALPLPGRLRSEVAPLAMMRHLQHQLAYSDERITALAQTDERVRRAQSVPNVGPVTAAAFVAAIDDVQRFRRAPEVEAYLGLVPRELSSGEMPRRGRITKADSSRVRWRLIQAAVSMLRLHDARTGGLAGLGHTDRGATGQGDGRRGPRAPARRNPLRAPARWNSLRAPRRRAPHIVPQPVAA